MRIAIRVALAAVMIGAAVAAAGCWNRGGQEDDVEKVEMPKGFPSEVPVYDPATLVTAEAVELAGGGQSYLVVMSTSDVPSDVFTWYEQELESGGWASRSETAIRQGGTLDVEKDKSILSVNVAGGGAAGSSTRITLSVGPST